MNRLAAPLRLLLLCAALVFGLIACNQDKGTGTSTTTGTTGATGSTDTGKKLKIGVSIPAADHGWTAGVKYWADEAAKLYPDIEFNIQTAEGPDKQIKDLDAMMVSGVDAIVVLATESAPITRRIKALKRAR